MTLEPKHMLWKRGMEKGMKKTFNIYASKTLVSSAKLSS